jgi:Tol biopolymer transport system component
VPVRRGIELFGANGSQPRKLPTPSPLGQFGETTNGGIGWSKNGRRIFFLTSHGPSEGRGMWASSITIDGSHLRQTPLDEPVGGATWSPGGWPLVFVPNSLTTGLEGRIGPNPDLWRLDGPGSKPHRILAAPGVEWSPIFSPDGSKIAYIRERAGKMSIWVVSATGSDPRRITPDLQVLGMSWSPGGKSIALAAALTGAPPHRFPRTHLYLASVRGGPLSEVSREEIIGSAPAWTPDGRWLTFSNFDGQIRRIHPDGSGAQTYASLPGEEVGALRWSPDGRHLAYVARPFPPED